MAAVVLYRHEVEERDLPFVCLRCGRPASLWKTKTFILASPGAGANVGKLNRIEVPLCAAHKAHWFWRGLFGVGLGCLLVACFLAGLLAVAEPGQVSSALKGPLLVAFAVGFFGLVLWLPVTLVLHFTSVRPTHVGVDEVTLAGVSATFVEELKEHRRGRPGRRKGGRRGGRRRRYEEDE